MACWFRPVNITSAFALIYIGEAGAVSNRFVMFARGDLAGDPVWISADDGGGGGVATTTSGYTANTWHHACGVFTSSTSRAAYLDGANSGTNATNITPSILNTTTVGSRFTSSTNGIFFNGLIAEVGIWNAALTAAEVASLADGMTCDKVRPQSLVFYAPLVRDLIDAKGGLTITNNNSATVANHPRVYA
jgi:hypothetical protein